MEVIKRSGERAPFKPNNIQKRIKDQAVGLKVNADEVVVKVIGGFSDGISTHQLDEYAAETAATMTLNHPDYSTLAARLLVTSLHKETYNTFWMAMTYLDANTSLLSEEYYRNCLDYKGEYETMVDHSRDFNFDYFGLKTLLKSYLLKVDGKVVERPQYLYMRVAVAIWGDNLEMVKKTYDLLSEGYFTHATPTLFNAGLKDGQLASCFLIANKGDDKASLMDTAKDVAIISAGSGGIGLHVHDVRATGSAIRGSGGRSNGLLPLLKTYNELSKWWDQGGGRRKGSFAIYLEPWHKDVLTLLDIRKNHGKDELRARELFPALWIPDLFMQRVEANGVWTLFCPNEVLQATGKALQDVYDSPTSKDFTALYEELEAIPGLGTPIKAQDLWTAILTSQMETGSPFMLYKDAANSKSNQQNIGVIKSSNLCVAPETQLLTSKGYLTIADLEDQEVEAWNGEEFSRVVVRKTAEEAKLLTVTLSNGHTLDVTEYHKWYVQRGYTTGTGDNKLEILVKRTHELQPTDKLIKLKTPVIHFPGKLSGAYTQGFFSGDGCAYKGKNHIDLYGEKLLLVSHLEGQLVGSYSEAQNKQRFRINDGYTKYEVPFEYSVESRLKWFAGLCDSDGCLLNNNGTQSIQIGSIHLSFLQEVQLMLQTLGINSKVLKAAPARDGLLPDGKGGMALFECQESFRLTVGADAIFQLVQLGFKTFRLKIVERRPNRNAEQFVRVMSVEDKGRVDATYCAHEPLRNKLTFNGVLTGNCTEILEVSTPDEIAVCNLASIALPKFVIEVPVYEGEGKIVSYTKEVDHTFLYEVTYQVTLNLNRVIDTTSYPVPETKVSNLKHRPVNC